MVASSTTDRIPRTGLPCRRPSEGTGPLPLISVVIPWIGREKYIAATIAALRAQDYQNVEIIVSDNSLSANSSSFLREIAGAGVRIILRNEARLNSADHFTACIGDAIGEYVMILSDDDLVEPGYLSGMYDSIRCHPSTSAVLGEQIIIGEDDAPIPPDSGPNKVRHVAGIKFLVRRLLNPRVDAIVTYVSVFGRRRDFLMHPYRDYPDGSNSDNFMMLCLAMCGDVSISSKKMYYRVYENSAGLKTPFVSLMESCVGFERDVVELINGCNDLTRSERRLLRVLIRMRNGSMMARRLFTLYRRRMTPGKFIESAWMLIRYFCGFVMGSR